MVYRSSFIVSVPESKAVLRKKRNEKDRFTDDGNNVAEGLYQFYRMYKNQMNLSEKIYNLYKINDIILTEDHAIYDENYRLLSVNPTKTRENYKKDATKIKVGDKIRKEDESLETVTSIEAYSGTHRTYTIKTSFDNFYADGILVDSEI